MEKRKTPYRVIISSGGTGGHIYPAIAVANGLKERIPDIEILFVGAKGKMEMQKVPEAGYSIEGLWISGLQRRLTAKNLMFPIKVISSLLKASSILRKFKPDIAAGFGGYASGPMLRTSIRNGVPALLQEQNSYAGLTNKLLAEKVNTICVAYDGMEKFFPKEKLVQTGNPVRKDIIDLKGKTRTAYKHFGFDDSKPVLFVMGGSLGARTINQSMLRHIDLLIKSGAQVIWQTGAFYFDEIQETLKNRNLADIRIVKFLKEMDLAYAIADVIVSRAGALSISELCLVGKATVLVPSPNVAEDHQTKNAMALVNKEAAVLVKDSDAENEMVQEALRLLNDESERELLGKNIMALGQPNATEKIVDELIKLLN